jgi:hypothetical protein
VLRAIPWRDESLRVLDLGLLYGAIAALVPAEPIPASDRLALQLIEGVRKVRFSIPEVS